MKPTKSLINTIFENKLSESETILNSILMEKAVSKIKDKKKESASAIQNTSNVDDSSGNNDLCDSSDNSPGNSGAVSEQDAFANIQKWRRHVRYTNPDRARDRNLSSAFTTQKKLDVLSKKKEFK